MNRVMPTMYFLLAIIVQVALHMVMPVRQLILFPYTLAGLLPFVAGVWLNISADNAMKRHHTTVKPFEATSALIEDSVFGLTRNPMYLGMALILAGIAVLLGSLTPWLSVAVFMVLVQTVFILPEERKLRAAFGEQFLGYTKRVRQWV